MGKDPATRARLEIPLVTTQKQEHHGSLERGEFEEVSLSCPNQLLQKVCQDSSTKEVVAL